MTATRRQIEPPKMQARTRIGTGGAMLAGVDGRTHGGRRFKELCADMVHHLGGEATAPQEAIIRRAAALSIWCEDQERALASGGDDFDVGAFTTAANTLRRLLSDLGLERRMKDVTPSLHEYINSKGAA